MFPKAANSNTNRISTKALKLGASALALASAWGMAPTAASADTPFSTMVGMQAGITVGPNGQLSQWTGANAPVVGMEGDRHLMTIEQTQAKAVLDWKDFRLKTNEILEFQQASADWLVVNRVHGQHAARVDGEIRALGSVYIFNDNGVLIGDGAQINTRQLVTGAGVNDVNVEDNVTTFVQHQAKAALDWQKFEVATDEVLQFQQQSEDWLAVNRIHGDDASVLDGELHAAGKVFVFDDNNGVDVGADAVLNAKTVVTGKGVSDVDITGNVTTITQSADKAILNWSDMSSQAGEVLKFNQERTDWIAMNRSLREGTTRIAGDIEADGHVYLIAPKGLSLAGSIQAQQLIASSLNLSDAQFEAGFTSCLNCNNLRETPRFSNSWIPNEMTYSVTGEQLLEWLAAPEPEVSEVVVESSSRIKTGALGKIMLFGNHVTNNGILSVQDEGQVILAAGENIWVDYDISDPDNRLEAFAGPWEPVGFGGSLSYANELRTIQTEAEQAFWEELTGTLYPIGYRFTNAEWRAGNGISGTVNSKLEELLNTMTFQRALEVQNTARNNGIIYSKRGGQIDFRGLNLEHFGSIEMESTANFRGSINFDARLYTYNKIWSSKVDGPPVPNNGTVIFGEGSLIQIVPDLEATDTLPLTEGMQSVGSLLVNAGRLHLRENSMVYMPGGDMSVWLDEGEHITGGRGLNGNMNNETGTRFLMEAGATIDLSGWESTVLPMGYHQVTGKLFAAQLSDSPLQRNGPLYRKEISVDRRHGTDFADWESFDNLTHGTLDMFLTDGGNFFLDGDNDFIMKSGSVIDVSGGKVTYEAGFVRTTLLRRLDGSIIDIREANPDELYMGLASQFTRYDPKWGRQETFYVPFLSSMGGAYEESYVEGGNAGRIDILAPDAILQGKVLGGVTVGKYQRNNMPEMGVFTLGDAGLSENEYKSNSIIIEAQERLLSAAFGLADSLEDEFGDLFGEEFDEENRENGITVDASEKRDDNTTLTSVDFFNRSEMGQYSLLMAVPEEDEAGNRVPVSVHVEEGVNLDLGSAGFALSAGQGGMRFDGTIRTRGGDVSLGGASLIMGPNAMIDTSAGWHSEYELDEYRSLIREVRVDGGDISLGQVNGSGIEEYLESASIIVPGTVKLNLGGGAWAQRDGTILSGKGGSLSVTSINADELDLEGVYNAEALGLGGHGELSIQTTRTVIVGGELVEFPLLPGQAPYVPPEPMPGVPQPERPEVPRSVLLIRPELYEESGFSAIHLSGERLMIAPGTQIEASSRVLQLRGSEAFGSLAPWLTAESGTPMEDIVEQVDIPFGLRPEELRQGMELSFATGSSGLITNGGHAGSLLVGEGSRIATEAGGSIRFQAAGIDGMLAVLGTLQADGGLIDLVVRGSDGRMIIGETARLLARGTAVTTGITAGPNGGDLREGYVLDGGTIRFTDEGQADSGQNSLSLTIEEGAILDVSGAQGVFDVTPESGPGRARAPELFASDGGTVSITAKTLDIDGATYRAEGGGAGASGGRFELNYEAPYQGGGDADNLDFVFNQIQSIFGWGFAIDASGNPVDSFLGTDLGELTSFMFQPVDLPDGLVFNSKEEFFEYFKPLGLEAAGPPPALIVGDPDAIFEFGGAAGSIDSAMISFAQTAGLAVGAPYDGPDRFARLPVEAINRGGFSHLELTSSPGILFAGDVGLGGRTADGGYQFDSITLAAPRILGLDGADVRLEANVINFTLPESELDGVSNSDLGLYDLALGATNIGGPDSQAVFTAKSGVLTDVTQGVFRGFGKTQLFSDGDLRLRGYEPDVGVEGPLPGATLYEGILSADNDLVLRADQVYTATGRNFLVEAGRSISVLPQEGGQPLNGTPYEAGANLTFKAPRIVQGGIIRSPLGAITLSGVDDGSAGAGLVQLLPGSITSVSSDGNVVPYGVLNNGDTWVNPLFVSDPDDPNSRNLSNRELRILPQRAVTIEGKDVDLAEGAEVDLSGGGDLLAGEFSAGVGGTRDWLTGYYDEDYNWVSGGGVYAILPGYDAGIAPVGLSSGGPQVGERIYLSGGSGLEAGYYTLLPAEYALLPGAYRVSAQHQYEGDFTGMRLGTTSMRHDGSSLQAGYRYVGEMANRDDRTNAFLVMPRETLFQRSSYNIQLASGYFSSEAFLEKALRENREVPDAPRTPLDGGSIVLSATGSLNLESSINTQAADGGRGGLADIQAQKIAVLGPDTDRAQYDGYLILDSAQLNALTADSLLLGGVRRQGEVNLELTTGATEVVVDNQGTVLTGSELLFASLGDITVKQGSRIEASGTVSGGANNLRVVPVAAALIDDKGNINEDDDELIHNALDYGTVLRLSANRQIDILRDPEAVDRLAALAADPAALAALNERRAAYGLAPVSNGGALTVEDGASLVSNTSLTMDATINTMIDEGASIAAKQISASSSRVSIGAVPDGTDGLVFGGGSLGALAAAEDILLKSYSTIDFHGPTTLRADGALTLDARSFRVLNAGGGAVTIAGSELTLANSNGGTASADAGTASMRLEGGTVYLSGGDKWLSGVNAVNIVATGRVIGQDENTLHVPGTLAIDAAAITADSGAQQYFDASGAVNLTSNGGADALAARSTFGATLGFTGADILNEGEIILTGGTVSMRARTGDVLLQGGSVDVTSDQVQIYDKLVGVGAGNISLIADQGNVDVQSGARLDVSGGETGGDAGALTLTAGLGNILLNGDISGNAAAGSRSGSLRMTSRTLGDFGGFNARLDAGGFRQSRYFEINEGDIAIGTDVAVQDFTVVANDGSITLSGTVETPGANGGRVQLSAARDVTLTGSARVLARANAAGGAGGTVFLETVGLGGGAIDVAPGALIDVSGSGEGGRSVRLRAPQIGGNEVAIDRIGGTITGARSIIAEAFSVYEDIETIDQAVIDLVSADAADFMTNAAAINARLGGGVQLAPGIELRNDGDMELVTDWDLSSMRYDGAAGVLTLRAAGDLLINASLSDGFDGTAPDATLLGGSSWAFNLTGGANVESPNSLAVLPQGQLAEGKGSVIIGGTPDTLEYYMTAPPVGDWEPEQPPIVIPADIQAELDQLMADGDFDAWNNLFLATYAAYTSDWSAFMEGDMTVEELTAAWPEAMAGADLVGPVVPHYGIEHRLYALDGEGNFIRDPDAGGEYGGFVELERDRDTGKYIHPVTGELISQDPETGDYADTAYYSRRALPWAAASGVDIPSQDMSNDQRFANYHDLLTDTIGYLQTDNSTGYLVRTGTSGINVAAGRDFVLQEKPSVLYTAGEQAPAIAGFDPVPGSYIPVNGGDISIEAGGSIKGAASTQLPRGWLQMEGSVNRSTGLFDDGVGRDHDQWTWHVRFDRYRAGVGALGGGNVDISAAGDIEDFTVNIPTTGRVSGGYTGNTATQFHQTGGGDLTLRAGGNIQGGVYYVGDGLGEVTAGGAFTATPDAVWHMDPFSEGGDIWTSGLENFAAMQDLYPLFFTSSGELNLQSGGDMNVEAVLDPLMGARRDDGLHSLITYTPDAAVSMFSAGGDVNIWGNSINLLNIESLSVAALERATFAGLANSSSSVPRVPDVSVNLELWPATLQATAAAGDIHVIGGLFLAPSATGNLELIARDSIQVGPANDPYTEYVDQRTRTFSPEAFSRNFMSRYTGIIMSQALPENLRTPDNPLIDGTAYIHRGMFRHAGIGNNGYYQDDGISAGSTAFFTPEEIPDLHAGDRIPALIYAGDGKVVLSDEVSLPKQVRIRAGQQIYFPHLTVQHNNPDDLTLLKAGAGIYMAESTRWGDAYSLIDVAGPGRLDIESGSDLWIPDNKDGITSRKITVLTNGSSGEERQVYPGLDAADISITVGLEQEPDYAGFADWLFNPEGGETPGYVLIDAGGGRQLSMYLFDRMNGRVNRSDETVLMNEALSAGFVNYVRGLQGLDPLESEAEQGLYLETAWDYWGALPVSQATPFDALLPRGAEAQAVDPAFYLPETHEGLVNYVRRLNGLEVLTTQEEQLAFLDEAWTLWNAMPAEEKTAFFRTALNHELRTTGREGQNPESERYETTTRGYEAISRLFPGAQKSAEEALAEGERRWTGNFETYSSRVISEGGGDINFVIPGGELMLANIAATDAQTGQPTDESGGSQQGDALRSGVITVNGGAVNIFSRDSVQVNRSRIMTAKGGNVMIWSSYGDIAAGAGAKTSISPAFYDYQANAWYHVMREPAGLPTGAGIATLASVGGAPAADVDLIAPAGIVDAGDAGLRVSGNFNVLAIQVLGTDNIDVSGVSTGLPTPPAAPPTSLDIGDLGSKSLTAGKALEDAIGQVQRNNTNTSPSLIEVEVTGYEDGEGGEGADAEPPEPETPAEEDDVSWSEEKVEFNVVSQTLDDAVRNIGDQAGYNVLYDAGVMTGQQAAAATLMGQMTLKDALTQLLGEGLEAVLVDDKTVMIRKKNT